jgi:hypothetical protein
MTQQFLQCPAHGVLASFKNYAEYEKTLKFVINKVAESKGLPQMGSRLSRPLKRGDRITHFPFGLSMFS